MKIHHHLGLGDHIICNGLVRYLLKSNPIELVVKYKNIKNVRRMFRDCDMNYRLVNDDKNIDGNLGWCFGGDRSIDFDQAFYAQSGVNFSHRWKSFYIERDSAHESKLIEHLSLPQKFALIHDTASAGKTNAKIRTDLPKVYLHQSAVEDSIFDWMGVIDLATEIHCVNSSFVHLVDSMEVDCKLYFYDHRPHLRFSKRLPWETINGN